MSAGLFLHFKKENLAYLSLIAYDEGKQSGRKGPFSFSGDITGWHIQLPERHAFQRRASPFIHRRPASARYPQASGEYKSRAEMRKK